jgi:hypothetical protein
VWGAVQGSIFLLPCAGGGGGRGIFSGGSEQADLAKDLSPPEAGDGKRKQERGRKKIVVDAT